MKKTILVCLFLLLNYNIFAQKYTISGYIEDAQTGEKISGANIFDLENPSLGTISNKYGFFSLTLPSMKLKLTASFIGYQAVSTQFTLQKDTVINFKLTSGADIEEVEINGKRKLVEDTQMGQIEIPIQTIKALPMLLGETDVLKAIQLLPGVQSGTEGTSGFYVRGGGPDQNLILLDGVPVYNVNHLFGFFSVFNADAISDISIIKGGFPAHYGGRLSSVLDIRMKEGNNKKLSGAVSVGLISSKITMEGPVVNEKTSFIFSARRTYLDYVAAPVISFFAKQNGDGKVKAGYFFYDINAKVNHKFSQKDRLFLSVYAGRDKAYIKTEDTYSNTLEKSDFDLHWGNITSAVRWNHVISNKLFMNSTLTYSRYQFLTGIGVASTDISTNQKTAFNLNYFSGIDDFSSSVDFDYVPSVNHTVKFGATAIRHIFNPGVNSLKIEENVNAMDTTFGDSRIFTNEFAVYAEDEFRIGQKFKMNAGFRFSLFFVDNQVYTSPEPRLSARYMINNKWSVKAAYSMMTQYLHLLSNSGIGMPTDLWLPVTKNVKPLKSMQYAAGTVVALTDNIDFSVEGYYKTMTNLIEYKEGASFFTFEDPQPGTRNWEQKIETGGKGWSYGAEFLLKGNYKNTSGWIGYTLSWSERQFENVSFGQRFPYRYDRRHDISIVVTQKFSNHFDIGVVWVYGTGNAVTLALEEYQSEAGSNYQYFDYNQKLEYFKNRNNYRMPSYHRLDISANLHKKKKYGLRTWSFGVYNVYNRQNPFFLNWGSNYNSQTGTDQTVLKQYSLFPIIPSISYKFVF